MRLFSFLFFIICHFTFSAVPKIKVRLAKAQKKISLSGIDLKSNLKLLGEKQIYTGKKTLNFNCSEYVKKERNNPLLVASLASSTGLIKWKNQKYLGELNILTTKNKKGCDLVNVTSLDTYISMLLTKEMHSSWPKEALKAQAVAARTYAYHKMQSDQVSKLSGYETYYDLENSEKHQVNGSFSDVTKSTSLASKLTSGEVLTARSGKITPIFFHSKCGGRTIRPEVVWSNKVEGYTNVECPFCHKKGTPSWQNKISGYKLKRAVLKTLNRKFNIQANKYSSLQFMKDYKQSNYLRVYYKDKPFKIQKSRLRSSLGRRSLPSNNFKIEKSNGYYKAIGKGNGHGVGLCQFGALELAKRGYNYKQILSHYFPKHRIKKVY